MYFVNVCLHVIGSNGKNIHSSISLNFHGNFPLFISDNGIIAGNRVNTVIFSRAVESFIQKGIL